ncbi:IS66 family insertion sequence element accessory protein TnpB [Roseovarius sp. M141]|uniref:IS66 family insertion sequence element accessory protein TnpB n=1 Tax=Roseovarius sp. M141 TaxID=2583806 RepID=UPI0026E54BDC|nr:IS66 family insertion sequence element accessory protein TnpB [Roseovarius sp. M141]
MVKILWHEGVGTSLYLKRLEAGKFIWPVSRTGDAVQSPQPSSVIFSKVFGDTPLW